MPQVIELKADCKIELEDALNVFGNRHRTPVYPPMKKAVVKDEATQKEEMKNGTDLLKSE